MQNIPNQAASREANDASLEVRMPSGLRDHIDMAAAMLGLDRSAFVRMSVKRAVDEVIEAQTHHHMSPEDAAAFVAALDAKPSPTPAALAAARQYRKRVLDAD